METERMVLRPLTESDVDDLVALHADPEVMRFLDQAPDLAPFLTPDFHAAIDKATGRFLGWFEFRALPGGEVELGYRLHKNTWGRGLATEGARALIDEGFERGVRKVVATTMFVNAGSRRVMEKCGLRHVRTFFVDWPDPLPGSEHGEVAYELTREDWLAASCRTDRDDR